MGRFCRTRRWISLVVAGATATFAPWRGGGGFGMGVGVVLAAQDNNTSSSTPLNATPLDMTGDLRYDGTTSDFVQQFYKRYLLGDQVPKVNSKAVPNAVRKALNNEFALDFDELPGLLQHATLWGFGYVGDPDNGGFTPIKTKCGLRMADIAVSKKGFDESGCIARRCSTPDGSVFYQSMFCNGYQMGNASFCAAHGGSGNVHAPMWSSGGYDDLLIPQTLLVHHTWFDQSVNNGTNFSIRAIHIATKNDPGSWATCPSFPLLIIPCRDDNNGDIDGFCEPSRDMLLSKWLQDERSKHKTSTWTIFWLVVGAIALLSLAGFLWWRRRNRHNDQRASKALDHYTNNPSSCEDRVVSQCVVKEDLYDTMSDHTQQTESTQSGNMCGSIRLLDMLASDTAVFAKRVPFIDVNMKRLITKGAYGEVYYGDYKGKPVAIKRLLRERCNSLMEWESFGEEIRLMAHLNHPNVLGMFGVAWNTLQNLSLLTEYMENGDLMTYLQEHGQELDWTQTKMTFALDIAKGLDYLHSCEPVVIHRDIKSRNVLLTKSLGCKISDFGISRRIESANYDETMTSDVGTALWSAPELLSGKKYSEKADIYSFGVVLSEIDTCTMPFDDARNSMGAELQPIRVMQLVWMGSLKPSFSKFCPEPIRELALACLSSNPKDRPTASEVVQALLQAYDKRSSCE